MLKRALCFYGPETYQRSRTLGCRSHFCRRAGHPVLVGTISIEKSERLSQFLKKQGIPHNVLNAKHHEREAEIIAQAGRAGAVTISTNMAGRGTDILLGGNPKFLAKTLVKEEATEETILKANEKALGIVKQEKEKVIGVGGLHVLGTERHEARRSPSLLDLLSCPDIACSSQGSSSISMKA